MKYVYLDHLVKLRLIPGPEFHRRHRQHSSAWHWRCRYHKTEGKWILHRDRKSSSHQFNLRIMNWQSNLPVCPRCYTQNTSQNQRVQWGQGWKGQRSHPEMPGKHPPQDIWAKRKGKQYTNLNQPSASGFITAMELFHQRKKVVRISTGSKQFDSILGG